MASKFENIPDLEEAYEAVKGQLYGPLDPALVKLKHKEIVLDAKEKRDHEFFPLGARSAARDAHAERERKDRDHQTRSLAWLLANDRAYREAHERAMSSFTNAGNAIDRAIEAGEKARERVRQRIEDYLASTARLRDGRHVMVDPDGAFRDQYGTPISAEDAAEVEGQPKRAGKPYDEMRKHQDDIDRDLAKLRGWSVEVGDMANEATDEKTPASRERLDNTKERADDLAKRAESKQHEFEQTSPLYSAAQDKFEEKLGQTASMVMPKLP